MVLGLPREHLVFVEIRNLARFNGGPGTTLVVSCHQHRKDNGWNSQKRKVLTILCFWLSAEIKKLDNITGHLTDSGLGAVFILNLTILQGRRHGDGTTGKVRIVMQSRHHRLACRWLSVACQKAEEVVLSMFAALGHQRKIRWQRSVVGKTANGIIRVWLWHPVHKLSRAFKHFTFIVWAIGVIIRGGQLLQLVLGVRHIFKITPMEFVNGMACRTHLTVHLKSTTQGSVIIRRCKSRVSPWMVSGRNGILRQKRHRNDRTDNASCASRCSGSSSTPLDLRYKSTIKE